MYAVGSAVCLGFFVICPFKSYFVDGVLMTLLPVEIMFVNQSTYVGYAIGSGYIGLTGCYAVLGTILYGASFILAVLLYSLHINLIEEDFKDLDDMWMEGSVVPLVHRRYYLTNICKKRQDIQK